MKKNTGLIQGNDNQKRLNDFFKSEKKKESAEAKAKEKLEKSMKKLEEKKGQVKEKRQQVKNDYMEKKKFLSHFRGIRAKILIAVFIPILMMACFGYISYDKSSSAIITNYENSTTDTLNAVSNYLNLGLTTVSDKAIEFSLSQYVQDYYLRTNEKDTLDNINALRKLKEQSIVVRETNDFIYAIHIMANVGSAISTFGSTGTDFYQKFADSDLAKTIEANPAKNQWVGFHNDIDTLLKEKSDEYAMAYVTEMSVSKGIIIMDISKEQILKSLNGIKNGDGSIVGFITGDGREILTSEDSKNVFTESSFYKDAQESKEASYHNYVTYNDSSYLFVGSKVGDTGAMVCALIPKAKILEQAKDIKDLSLVFVIVACIIALIIGTYIAGDIGKAISKLMKSITQASKGDLTAKFDTKRKDEFFVLSKGLTDMTKGMSNLIGEVAGVGTKVSGSADILSSTSEKILEATKDISLTIDEIERGVVQQASDTEHCLGQMSNLSDKINQVYSSTYEIEKIANNTKGIVGDGLVIIDELNDKSKSTANVTQMVIKDIEALEIQSKNIGNFVGIINEIASQTNLLSLNASIEAARAGDAGRGFAVVADEIRKLADQSVKAASEIQGIVTEIQNKTQGTVQSARQAEGIVETQTDALKKTIKVFEDINNHVGSLVTNLDNISIGVKGIETAKEDTLDAIRNISAVAQQTAAASEEVSATANSQISSVENLSQSALELASDAKNLESAIQMFKI
jgi:methyl-accepting chemotaxis protein